MLGVIDLRGRRTAGEPLDYARVLPRAAFDVDAAAEVVRPICANVAERGIAALAEYSARFDQVVPETFAVPAEALERAAGELDPELRSAFEVAIARRRRVSEAEFGTSTVEITVGPGAQVRQRMVPVGRVGLYVPGGLAPLASPPQREHGGLPHPNILALCHLLGVEEVYAVGGAQAIAMFAYGVPGLCDAVDLVTGPGNVYVVAAKRLVKGRVSIDSEAGPTEIAVLADETANPVHVAADLISQAEHDPLAAAVLVTDSARLAEQVADQLAEQVPAAKHATRIGQALTGRQSAVILVDDLEQGIAVVNAYAAEHVEIHTAAAEQVAGRISNAGAIFVGPWSPVSLGDYCAGSTHVLPTAGCATHSSGLNTKSFLKAVHVVQYSQAALAEVARDVEVFADAEDLPAHGAAVSRRFHP